MRPHALSVLIALTLTACTPPGGSTPTPGASPGTTAPGASGTLDASFGEGGIVTTDFTEERSDIAYGVALQADGKIVAGGVTVAPDPKYSSGTFALVRYLPNGQVDSGFGLAGRAFTAKGSTSQGKDVVVQADGKIVTAGWYQSGSIDFLLSRHFADGQLDAGFGQEGHATAGFGVANARSMTMQADGKLLVVGYGGSLLDDDALLARYTPDGALDPGFSGDGTLALSWGTDSDEAAAVVESGGKLLVCGSSETHRFVVTRLNSDGSLDPGFGTEGTVKVETGEDYAWDLAVAPDGGIIVVGDKRIMRFTASGAVDTAFGTNGTVQLSEQSLTAVEIQPDGKILAAGGQSGKVVLLRLNPDGKSDAGFAGQGMATVAVPGADGVAYDIVRQPDGRIVLAGKAFQFEGAQDDFLLMRVWP